MSMPCMSMARALVLREILLIYRSPFEVTFSEAFGLPPCATGAFDRNVCDNASGQVNFEQEADFSGIVEINFDEVE